MDLASIPYLEADPPEVFNSLSAESIMNRKVVMVGVEGEPQRGAKRGAGNTTTAIEIQLRYVILTR